MDSAQSFFRDMKFPPDFYRSATPIADQGLSEMFKMHPFLPGGNMDGKINNFAVDPTSATFETPCVLYEDILNAVKTLSTNPTGLLRRNLILCLRELYPGVAAVLGRECVQQFLYRKQ
jgi:hypothetical protein